MLSACKDAKVAQFCAFALIFFNVFQHVNGCVQTDTLHVNHTTRIVNVEPKDTVIKHHIGGTVTIVDGCRFSVRNMTIIPSGNGVYFYGVPANNNSENYPRIVSHALGSYNGQKALFHLDREYSFGMFSIVEIYSEGDHRPYGAFAITGNVTEYYGTNVNNQPLLDFDSASVVSMYTSWTQILLFMSALLALL